MSTEKWVIVCAHADGEWGVWDGTWSQRRLTKAARYDTREEAEGSLTAALAQLHWDHEDGYPALLIAKVVREAEPA